jgi:hypothetical protein
MIIIRTAEELWCALDSPPDLGLRDILEAHYKRLAEYDGYSLAELAIFIVVLPSDTLHDIQEALPGHLLGVEGGEATFAIQPEIAQQHEGFFELVFVLSDDGFGLVLLVSMAEGTDPTLLAACRRHIQQDQPFA